MIDESLSRKERTRQEIIRAAHDLFISQGYHGTSMRQIAQKAGIALGGVYNHFESKEDVFREVFFEYHPYREILSTVIAADGQMVEQFLRNAFEGIITTLRGRPDLMNLMFIEIVEFKSAHAQELLALVLPQVAPVIQRMSQNNQGRLRPIPTLILLRLFVSMFFGYYLTEVIFSSLAPAEFRVDAAEYFVDVLIHGVLQDDRCTS